MPNIPGLPEALVPTAGVHMNAPPADLVPRISELVRDAGAQIEPGERGKVVWIAQKIGDEKSVNFAIVHKHLDGKLELAHWVGKTWGTPVSAGLAAGTRGSLTW